MKQYYVYDARSSEIVYRAGSIEDLFKKMKKGGMCKTNQDNYHEPFWFYLKQDVHGNDDDAREVSYKKLMKEAKRLGLVK